MKILFSVHQFFPKHYTGTERLVMNLCKQMQKMGHQVKVLTYSINDTEGLVDKGDFFVGEYEYKGVPVITLRHKTMTPEVSFNIFDPVMEKALDEIFAKEQFDVLHVCHPMRIGSIVRVAKKRNIPYVLTLTDFWLMCPRGIAVTSKGDLCNNPENTARCVRDCFGPLWSDKLKHRFNEMQELFAGADYIVSATRFLKQMFESSGLAKNIRLVPFGKDYSFVTRNDHRYTRNSEITIGFLSTLLPHKGGHIVLKAYNLAGASNLRIKLYGDHFHEQEYFNDLQKMAGGTDKIEFCGKYDYEEMPTILNGIDLIVVPSIWWENSPLVLLRALAHSVPAIVSDLGGMTEVITDGVNGFTFKAGNAESLAVVMKKISENPEILNEMKTKINHPPRIEEEAFEYEKLYLSLTKIRS